MSYPNFSARKTRPRGPVNAKVLIVGEAPGEKEDEQLTTFVGAAGYELDRMLAEARFITSACRFTNVIPWRPDGNDIDFAFCSSATKARTEGAILHAGRYCKQVAMDGLALLRQEISERKPSVIIAAGGTALWALTEKEGIEDWRGSELTWIGDHKTPVIPIYHPSAILHAQELRLVTIHDLKKANRVWQFGLTPWPQWNFTLRPSFMSVMTCLDTAEAAGTLAVDIETKQGHIGCVGIAWNELDAICIPMIRADGTPYWSEEEEVAIVMRLRKILDSGHEIIGQNFIYDAQYFARRMLTIPRVTFDTLLAQHVLYPGTPKSLAYLSSTYCNHHVFWKDDGKEWDPRIHTEEQLWAYNCTDCVKTFEVWREQKTLLKRHALEAQFAFIMRLWPHVLNTMIRGVRVDPLTKEQATVELGLAIDVRRTWLDTAIGYAFNPRSTPQMKQFFYDEMGIKPTKHRKTKKTTLDKKALKQIGDNHALLYPITQTIEETRSLSVFKATFAEASLDVDGRMRCSFNIGGTETFRFSSSESAFGIGTNLQNIPKGDRSTTLAMPNMRKLFIPDKGYTICEIDLAGADAQVVAWEADDEHLKAAFRAGLKIHAVNAKDLFGANAGPDGKREPYYTWTKQGVHLTNYCGKPRTMAATLGILVHEAEKFQKRWFGLHPSIPEWHKRIEGELSATRGVKNKFGFRRVYFERIESLLAEAVAWIPQSTVGLVINHAYCNIAERTIAEVLLQVHDSLVFQIPTTQRDAILAALHPHALIPIPYKDPLIIQLGLKYSDISWGAAEDYKWPDN